MGYEQQMRLRVQRLEIKMIKEHGQARSKRILRSPILIGECSWQRDILFKQQPGGSVGVVNWTPIRTIRDTTRPPRHNVATTQMITFLIANPGECVTSPGTSATIASSSVYCPNSS
jgi:hypothetical protein